MTITPSCGWDVLDRELYANEDEPHTCPDESCPWRPLEQFAQLAARALSPIIPHPAAFMHMGDFYDGPVTVHLYKHADTRRYLNLDDAGHAYAYEGGASSSDAGRYVPLGSPADAIARCYQ